MNEFTVLQFLEEKKEFLFPNDKFSEADIESALLMIPQDFESIMNVIPFRKPKTVQLVSYFLGPIGVDRFYLGDIRNGILKYFTFGGAGIWWIKDILNAKNMCRAYNCRKLLEAMQDPTVVSKMMQTDANLRQVGEIAKSALPIAKSLKDSANDIGKTFHVQ